MLHGLTWSISTHLPVPLAGGELAPSQRPSLRVRVAPRGCGSAGLDPAPPSSSTGTGCSGRLWLMQFLPLQVKLLCLRW